MVIAASALVAILRNEPYADALRRAIVADPLRLVPATCVFEARMVLVSRRGEHVIAEIDLWLTKISASVIAVDADLVEVATQAWLAYGKGRHPAGLNFADCFSYALAKRADELCSSSARISPRPICGRPVHDVAAPSARSRR